MLDKSETSQIRLSTGLSILALVITASTFYLDHFHHSHDLSASIVRSNFDTELVRKQFELDTNIVVANRGTETEVLMSVNPVFIPPRGGTELSITNPKGPFIIKPGEAISFRFKRDTDAESLANEAEWSADKSSARLDAAVRFIVVGFTGAPFSKDVPLWKLIYRNETFELAEGERERQKATGIHFVSLLSE